MKSIERFARSAKPLRRRNLRSILVLSFFSVLVSGLAAELAWRAARPFFGKPISVVFDPELGWKYRPNQSVRHRSRDFDVAVEIDGAGHRNAGPPSPGSSGGRPLAVFVGDSLTFGWGVEAEQAFPFLLRDRLGVEVLNLGVAGYGTDQSYLNLRMHGLPLRPAWVVYAYCGNDIAEVAAGVRYGRPKPWFRQEGGSLVTSWPRDTASLLNRHSQFYASLRSYLEGLTDIAGPGKPGAQELIGILVRRMARESRAASARFVVVSDDTPWLEAATKEEPGAIYVEVHGAFDRAIREGSSLSFAHDPHWNSIAHRIVAEQIARAAGSAGADPRSASSSLPRARQTVRTPSLTPSR